MKRWDHKYLLFVLIAILTFINISISCAEEGEGVSNATVVGVIKFEKNGVTPNTLKQIDRLVPVIKKMSADKIVKLDCRYKGATNNESDVRAAYKAATRIEKYLREYHRLKLDLWITTQLSDSTKENQKFVFSVFKDQNR